MTSIRTDLLVSDEAVRTAIAFALEIEGFEVGAYANASALLAARTRAPDCIVIDLEPDGPNPIKCLALLRRRGIHAPAIILASDCPVHTPGDINELGAVWIDKPLLSDALAATIVRIAAPS